MKTEKLRSIIVILTDHEISGSIERTAIKTIRHPNRFEKFVVQTS